LAVVLRCQRLGRKNLNFFRIVACDERAKGDGRVTEVLGTYTPGASDPAKMLTLKADRVAYWLSVGAQLTDTTRSLIKQSKIAIPARKKRERKRPAGKAGVGGARRKPARFKMTKAVKLRAAKAGAAPAAEKKAE